MEQKQLNGANINSKVARGHLQPDEDTDTLESILQHVGEMGRYQILLFLSMAPFAFVYCCVYFLQMFITTTPQRHWCKVPQLQHLDMELRRNLTAPLTPDGWDRCSMYDANWTHVLIHLTVPPDTNIVPCKYGWEFELDDIPYQTIVSERGWVCEHASNIPLAQSIFFVGSLFRGIFFGWMADRYGRVPAIVGSNIMAMAGGIGTIYTSGLWDFIICRFLVGTSFDSCFMIIYILVLEYIGTSHRSLIANTSLALYYGGASVVLPWIAIWISDWRKLLWYTNLPILLVVIVPFTIPESARWLSSRGQTIKAVKVMRRFEKVNGTKIPEDILNRFIMSSNQPRNTDESLITVFRSAPLRKMVIILMLAFTFSELIIDGLVRMSEDLGLDFFVTFTVASATEIPSILLVAFLLDRLGRISMSGGPALTAGCLILIAAFIPKGVALVSVTTIARFMVNMSVTAMMQWCMELLPTPVRASGSSVIHVLAFAATTISPYVVFSGKLCRLLPFFILSCIGLLAGTMTLLLPETKGMPMPQTIAEGEKLAIKNTLCGKHQDSEDDIPLHVRKSSVR
ncbi:solute carrier family 22 member 3-like isoform X2 [Leptidea sinapis]|uniref:solute carrier family 22 member 3-like isoform X2 n=1 Tax=Leptidea sinapis TaxID=189913 RepID=UPI0021C48CCE|nr:solute carrier family 22 member 3-like isoform X2 [Leptidea sinapis]